MAAATSRTAAIPAIKYLRDADGAVATTAAGPRMGRATPGVQVALQTLEVGAKLGGSLAADVPIFLESLVDDFFQLGRKIGIQTKRWQGRPVQNGVEREPRRISTERQRTGRHFIEHHAEGKQVGARVEFLASHLFRGHVSHGAERGAGTGQLTFIHSRPAMYRRDAGRGTACRHDLGQAEVENLGVTAFGHKDVGRLDVAMDDALAVRGIQRVGDFNAERQERSRVSIGRPAIACFSVVRRPETPWR